MQDPLLIPLLVLAETSGSADVSAADEQGHEGTTAWSDGCIGQDGANPEAPMHRLRPEIKVATKPDQP